MSRLKIVSKASIVGGGRQDYISKVKVKEHENTVGNTRPMFSEKANRLSRRNAQSLLKDGIEENTVREIVVALTQEHFDQLGANDDEREHFLRTGIRRGMKTLLKELKAADANWIAAIHRNTDAPHVHILIGEKFRSEEKKSKVKTIKSLSDEKPLPKSLLKITDGETALNNIFIKEIEKHWIGLQPIEQKTIADKSYLLPPSSPQFYENGFEYLTNQMINPKIAARLENKTILYRENGSPVFVKRDAEGNVTGGNWQTEKELNSRKWLETGKGNGWFYTGNLKTAEKLIVVDTPLEAIAIESLYHKKDLSKIAFINLGNKNNVEEFLELIEESVRNKPLEIVWSKSKTSQTENGEYVANQAGREAVEELVNELKNQGRQISLRNFQPRIAKTWAEELQLNETIRLSEWKSIVTNQYVSKNFLQSSNQAVGSQNIRQIDTTPAKQEILNGSKALDWKLKKEAENIESQKPSEEELLKIRQRVQEFKNDKYQKETEELRKIPISWVANMFGLEEKERGVWTDSGKQFKLKIWSDRNTFDDYYNSKKLGGDPAGFRRAGAVNLAIYLSNHSLTYQEAREQLVDRFIGSQSGPLPELKKKPILAEPLHLAENDFEKLPGVIEYLENRGISRETIELAVGNKTLFANNYGSAVFVMRDFDGSVIGHSWRSVVKGDTRRQNTPGTFKEFGSFYLGDPATAKELVLVEAPIEALSYYELNKAKDWSETAIVSLHGISITETLAGFIKNGQTDKITIALNNSVEADKVAVKLKELFDDGNKSVVVEAPYIGEDWNEYLVSLKKQEALMEAELPKADFVAHEAQDVTEHGNSFEELSALIENEIEPGIPVEQNISEIRENGNSDEPVLYEPAVLRIEGGEFNVINKEDFRPVFAEAFDRFIDDHPRQEALKQFKEDFVDASVALALSMGDDVGELAKGRKRLAPEKILYVIEEQSGEYVKRPEAFLLESVLQTTLPNSPVGLEGFWSSLKRNGIEIFTSENLINENIEKYKFEENPYFEDEIVSIVETENPLVLEARLASGLIWEGTAESEGQIAIQAQAYSTSVMRHADLLNRRGEYLKKNVETQQLESNTTTVRINVVYDEYDGLYRSGYEAATSENYAESLLDLRAAGFRSRRDAILNSQNAVNEFLQSDAENSDWLKVKVDEKFFGVKRKKSDEVIEEPLIADKSDAEAKVDAEKLEQKETINKEVIESVKITLNRQSELKKDRIANQFITKFEREDLATALRLFDMTEMEKAELSKTLEYMSATPENLKSLEPDERKKIKESVKAANKTYEDYLKNIRLSRFIDNRLLAESNEENEISAKVEIKLKGSEILELLINDYQEAFDRYTFELGKFKEGEERVSFISIEKKKLENGKFRTSVSGVFWSDVHQKSENAENLFSETKSKRGIYEKEIFVLDKVSVSAENGNSLLSEIEAFGEATKKIEKINTDEVFKPILDKALVNLQTRLENVSNEYNQIIKRENYEKWLNSKELVSYAKHKTTHKFSFADGTEWKGEALDVESALEKAQTFRKGLKLREGTVNAKGEYQQQILRQEEIWSGNGHLIFNYLQDTVDNRFRGYIDIKVEEETHARKISFQQAGAETLMELKAKTALEAQKMITKAFMPRAGIANKKKFDGAIKALEFFERSSYEQLDEFIKGEKDNERKEQRREESERSDDKEIGNSNREIEESSGETTSRQSREEEIRESELSEAEAQTDLSEKTAAKFAGNFVTGNLESVEGEVFDLDRSFNLTQAKAILGSKGMDSLMFEHLDDAKPFTKTDGREIYEVLLNDLSYRLKNSEFVDLSKTDKNFIAEKVGEKLKRNGYVGIQINEDNAVILDENIIAEFRELDQGKTVEDKKEKENKTEIVKDEAVLSELSEKTENEKAIALPSNVIPTIGFTNEYYTLWYVVETPDGEKFTEYVQNLSLDLETAKAKAAEKFGDYKIDLDLRGYESDFGNGKDDERLSSKYADHEFHFGKLAGQDIRESKDVWQLNRAREFEFHEDTRTFAHNRMIDLGELHDVRGEWMTSDEVIRAADKAGELSGWHFENGKRITLELVVKHKSWFETTYGSSAIQIFKDADNRIYKYLGSSPIQAEIGEIVTVTGTIDHSSYNDVNETRLKRVKEVETNEDKFVDMKLNLDEALKILRASEEIQEAVAAQMRAGDENIKNSLESSGEINTNAKEPENLEKPITYKKIILSGKGYHDTRALNEFLYDKAARSESLEIFFLYYYGDQMEQAGFWKELKTANQNNPNFSNQAAREGYIESVLPKYLYKEMNAASGSRMKTTEDLITFYEKFGNKYSETQIEKTELNETYTKRPKEEINDNEHAVFIALGQEILNSTNGQFGYAGDANVPEGMSENQFKGYVAQLKQKGYFEIADELKQLSVGENFENYANAKDLFVGKSFERNFEFVKIVGKKPETNEIEIANETKTKDQIREYEGEKSLSTNILSEDEFYNRGNFLRKNGENGQIFNRLESVASNNLDKYEIYDTKLLKIADLSKAIIAKQMIELKKEQLNASLEKLENTDLIADKIVLNREIGKLDGYLMTIEDLESKNLPIPFSLKNAGDLGLNQIAKELQYDGIGTDSKIEIFDEKLAVLIGNADYDTYRAKAESEKGRSEAAKNVGNETKSAVVKGRRNVLANTEKSPHEITRAEAPDFIKTLKGMPNETSVPTPNTVKEGAYSIESIGDDPYIFQMQYVNPMEIDYSEKYDAEDLVVKYPTTQKYIEWYREGIEPEAISVIYNQPTETLTSTNRRRVVAARAAGVNKIPAWIELGKHKEFIEKAIAEGKEVPGKVMAEYKDLQSKYAPKIKQKSETDKVDQIAENSVGERSISVYKIDLSSEAGRKLVSSFYKKAGEEESEQTAFGYKKYIWGDKQTIRQKIENWQKNAGISALKSEILITPVTDARIKEGVATFRLKIWEISKNEYLRQQFVLKQMLEEERIERAKKTIANLEKEAEARKLRKTENSDLSNLRLALPRMEERLANFDLSETTISQLGRHYVAEVAKSISKGEVPNERRKELAGENQAFRKAVDNRERYEKGRNTSFGNRTQAVDDSMRQESGYKVKRQDGKEILEEQKAQIAKGVNELESVFGNLKDYFRKGDITIVHTSGKMPFLKTAGGLYVESERAIVIGVKGSWTGQEIRSLAHEFGHWLDNESGSGIKETDSKYEAVTLFNRGSRKSIGKSSMLSEMDSRYDANGTRNELIRKATLSMNGTKYNPAIDKALKAKNDAVSNLPETDQRFIEITRTVFGNYWYSPREIFARLVEQYVSEKLSGGAVVAAEKRYRDVAAYWSKENFDALMPDLEKAIEDRFKLVAAKLDVEYAEIVEKTEASNAPHIFGNDETAKITVEENNLQIKIEGENQAEIALNAETTKVLDNLEDALKLVVNQELKTENPEEYEALAELREEAIKGITQTIERLKPTEESVAKTDAEDIGVMPARSNKDERLNEVRTWKSKPVALSDLKGDSTKEKSDSYNKELAVRKLAAEFLNDAETNLSELVISDKYKELAALMILVGESFDEGFTIEEVIERAKEYSYEIIEKNGSDKAEEKAFEAERKVDEDIEDQRKTESEKIVIAAKKVVEISEEIVPKGTFAFAEFIKNKISSGKALGNNTEVALLAEQFFGNHLSSGLYNSQDIYNAVELGANLWVKENAANLLGLNSFSALEKLKETQNLLPTQVSRTDDKIKLQQFSTPLTESFLTFKLAAPAPDERILEPSAGTGNLAAWALGNGNQVVANELDPKRAECLKYLGCEEVYTENAEFLNSLLPKSVKPSTVIMNPPFSSSVLTVRNNSKHGSNHVIQALNRLEENGRLVAILGEGASVQKTGMESFWDKVYNEHTVRANVGVDGREYYKFGTTFGNQIIVIDKVKNDLSRSEAVKETVLAENQSIKGIIENYADKIIDSRNRVAFGRTSESEMERNDESGGRGNERREDVAVSRPESETGIKDGDPTAKTNDGGGKNKSDDNAVGNNSEQSVERGRIKTDATNSQPNLIPAEKRVKEKINQSEIEKLENEIKSVIKFGDNKTAKNELANGSVEYQVERFTGAQKHPATIVESPSLSSVQPPQLSYVPAIPKSLIETGKLSDLQLEAVMLAGQRHEKWLDGKGWAGFILGDGTGLGKTAEFLAIGLDKWNRGRKRILFLTLNNNALPGLESEMNRLEMSHIPLKELSTFKIGKDLEETVGDGILFATYPTFISEGKDGKTRYDQVRKWLGDDGVILMDESHRMQNYLMSRGKGSLTGERGVELQRANPNLQVVYGSATFAKDVNALAAMDRLELWGTGTQFPGGFQDFKSEIGAAGTGAMELVAFHLKATGAMVSREISWLGAEVVFEEKKLEPEQIEMYNKTAEAWQLVYRKMEEAISTAGASTSQTERMTRQMFFGASQRFYRNFVLSTKVPMLQELGDKYLNSIEEFENPKTGEKTKHETQVVLGIMGTGEARTEAQVKRAAMDNTSLDELDFSPRETIVDFVKKHFPTSLHTEVETDDGGTKVIKMIDGRGEEIQCAEAVELQKQLLESLQELDLPDNPLDAMVNYWGRDNVAEITGRKRGIYINPQTGQKEYAKRVDNGPMDQASRSEMEAFQSGRKRLSIVSKSSSASINLHDDANRELPPRTLDVFENVERARILAEKGVEIDEIGKGSRRVMILGELPPSSVDAVQLLGRVLRSHSHTQPKYVLPLTDIPGETRFLMMVAQKLETMGAITKGDREKASGMDLSDYNLENEYGNRATYAVLTKLNEGNEELIGSINEAKGGYLKEKSANAESFRISEIDRETGKSVLLKMGIAKMKDGVVRVSDDTIEKFTSKQFFNRLLMMDFHTQGALVDEFYQQYMKSVQNDKAMGLFDEGVQGIKGTNIRLAEQKVVNVDEKSGAETVYSKVLADVPTRKISLETVLAKHAAKENDYHADYRDANFYHNQTSGNVIFVEKAGERKNGRNVESSYRILTPAGQKGYIKGEELGAKFSRVTPDSKIEIPLENGTSDYISVKEVWAQEAEKVPATITEEHHIISGKVLDIWKRMKNGNMNSQGEEIGKLKTVRVKFGDETRLLGIELPKAAVTKTLRELNAINTPVDGREIHDMVMNAGERIKLVENISLERSSFKGQKVIEVKGLDYASGNDAVKNLGVKKEYYSNRNFYFVPKHEEQGVETIEKVLKRYPVLGDEKENMIIRGVNNETVKTVATEKENSVAPNAEILRSSMEESKVVVNPFKAGLEAENSLLELDVENNVNSLKTVAGKEIKIGNEIENAESTKEMPAAESSNVRQNGESVNGNNGNESKNELQVTDTYLKNLRQILDNSKTFGDQINDNQTSQVIWKESSNVIIQEKVSEEKLDKRLWEKARQKASTKVSELLNLENNNILKERIVDVIASAEFDAVRAKTEAIFEENIPVENEKYVKLQNKISGYQNEGKPLSDVRKAELLNNLSDFALENRDFQGFRNVNELREDLPENVRFDQYNIGRTKAFAETIKEEASYSKAAEHQFQINGKDLRVLIETDGGKIVSRQNFAMIERDKANVEVDGWSANDVNKREREHEELLKSAEEMKQSINQNGMQGLNKLNNALNPLKNPLNNISTMLKGEYFAFHMNPAKQLQMHPAVQLMSGLSDLGVAGIEQGVYLYELNKTKNLIQKQSEILKETVKPTLDFEANELSGNLKKQTGYLYRMSVEAKETAAVGEKLLGMEKIAPIFKDNELEILGELSTKTGSVSGIKNYHDNLKDKVEAVEEFQNKFSVKYGESLANAEVEMNPQLFHHFYDKSLEPATINQKETLNKMGLAEKADNLSVLEAEIRFNSYRQQNETQKGDVDKLENYWKREAEISEMKEPPVTKEELGARIRGQQEFIETKLNALQIRYDDQYEIKAGARLVKEQQLLEPSVDEREFGYDQDYEFSVNNRRPSMKALEEPVGVRLDDQTYKFLNPNDFYNQWSKTEVEAARNQISQNKNLFDDTIERFQQAGGLLNAQLNGLENDSEYRMRLGEGTKLLRASEVSEILDETTFTQEDTDYGQMKHTDIAEKLKKVEVADGIDETASVVSVYSSENETDEEIRVEKLDELQTDEIEELKQAVVEAGEAVVEEEAAAGIVMM